MKQYSMKEFIVMGDLNLDRLNKTRRKKLKDRTNSYHMTQLVKSPTRITNSTRTLLDLIFTTKPDRITKISNLITGLSDHNFTLITRKLSKTRLNDRQISQNPHSSPYIPKNNHEPLANELNNVPWSDIINWINTDQACDNLMTTIKHIISKFTRTSSCKENQKIKVPWINHTIWDLMKRRDSTLKRAVKGTSGDVMLEAAA